MLLKVLSVISRSQGDCMYRYTRLIVALVLSCSVVDTPLFSVQRIEKLIEAIETLISNVPHHVGIELYCLKTRKTLYAKNSHIVVTPASSTKLLLGLAALESFGKDFKFTTALLTNGHTKKGTLHGNLYLKGSGDPSLTSADTEELFKRLCDQGITAIIGNVYLDQEEFEVESYAPGFTMDNIGKPWSSLPRGLLIDRKVLSVKPLGENDLITKENIQATLLDAQDFIRTLLEQHAIAFSGTVQFQKLSSQCDPLALHHSQPLEVLLKKLLKESDNLYADCLLKKLGTETYKTPGNWQNGRRALQDFLQTKLDIPLPQTRIADGAGLSRYNLLSPHHLVKLLIRAYDHPDFSPFLDALPIAGIDGTLSTRMADIASKVKAKTGTLNGVSALAGYLETDNGIIICTILSNGLLTDVASYKTDIEDALCRLVVTHFSQEPILA